MWLVHKDTSNYYTLFLIFIIFPLFNIYLEPILVNEEKRNCLSTT